MSRRTRPVLAVAAAVLLAVVVAPTGIGSAGLRSDVAAGVLPRGTTVGGVDVSGLDRSAALAAVRRVVERDFDRPAVLRVGTRSYSTSLRALGVTDDAEAAVDAALRQSRRGAGQSRLWDRVLRRTTSVSVPVRVSAPRAELLRAVVARAVREARVEPVSAQVLLSGAWLSFRPAVTGRRLDPVAATAALRASLRDGASRAVAPVLVAPTAGNATIDTVLLIHTGENRLFLYQGRRVVRIFPVATGSPDFPTPSGHFRVERKRYLPTWVNPHPDEGWGKLEPPTIPPGPKNPLGTRAMNLDAPNIRIHGTPSTASVGYSASHGCIRMRSADVEALYPMVPTGTSVFITAVGPPTLPPAGAGISVASLAEGG
ncbi:MAG: L,D-transpeptidase family protein [Mycobacteriales bacterium]